MNKTFRLALAALSCAARAPVNRAFAVKIAGKSTPARWSMALWATA